MSDYRSDPPSITDRPVILAALAPLAGNTGLAIVDPNGRPLLVTSFSVGRLVPYIDEDGFAYEIDRQDKRREVTPGDAVAFAAQVLPHLRDNRVTRLALEVPAGDGTRAQRARLLAAAIREACADLWIEIAEYEPKAWRAALSAADPTWSAQVVGLDTVQREAIGLLTAARANVPGVAGIASKRPLLALSGGLDETAGEPMVPPVVEQPPDLDAEQAPAPMGPRIMGVDSGSRTVAITIAEGDAPPLRYIWRHSFKVGVAVLRAKPKRYTDGRISTHRTIVTRAQIDALCDGIARVIKAYHVGRVVLETVEDPRIPSDNGAKAASIARALIVTARIDGAIGQAARAVGAIVETVSHARAHGRVVGRIGKESDGTERIRAAIAVGFGGTWATGSDEHENDAGVCCLYGVMPLPVAKPREKGAKTPKQKRPPVRPYVERERARKRQERAAAGCVCEGTHVAPCPLARGKRPGGRSGSRPKGTRRGVDPLDAVLDARIAARASSK